MGSSQRIERLTIALPPELMNDIDAIKDEMKINRSELVRTALQEFIKEHKRRNLQKIAIAMKDEYEGNEELRAFTSLDGEEFID